MRKPHADDQGHVQFCAPVIEQEETDDDSTASAMECPCCGNRYIKFRGQPKFVAGHLEIEMACSTGHRWTFILGEEDEEMAVRCWVYDWPEWPENPKPLADF